MKLTIEHIAPYLPYGLNFRTSKHQYSYGKHATLLMNGLSIDDAGEPHIEFIVDGDLIFSNNLNPVKPILRPLSSLTKPQIEQLAELLQVTRDRMKWLINKHVIGKSCANLSYEMMTALFKNHFDVFNLIPQGLAIDENTVTH